MTIDHKNPETRSAPPQTPEVTKKKLGAKTIALIGGGVVFVAGAAAGLITALMPREVQAAPPLPSETFTSGPVTPGPETGAPTVKPSEVEPTATATATASEVKPTVEPSATTPENNYSQEVAEQNAEKPNTFLKRPIEERLVLISALLKQADEKFPDRYVDIEYDMKLWEMNPLKVASKDNTNEEIVRQHKYMSIAAVLGTNLGAEKDTDASLETAQKIAGGLTIETPQEGGKGRASKIIEYVTKFIEEHGIGAGASYKDEVLADQNEENFECTTSDGESRTCRNVSWRTSDTESTEVKTARFAYVEFTGETGQKQNMWVPDVTTVTTVG